MNAIFRLPFAIHVFLYRQTGGRLVGRVQGLDVLLLTTKGHRTGKTRTTPLGYFEHQGGYVVIASNGGSDRHPGWFHNLRNDSRAWIEVGERRLEVRAEIAGPIPRAALWRRLMELSPGYGGYAKRTQRQIPMVTLRPAAT
jgi:deazaflavin-dependent oxidoreductase (nitroreductase family)